MADHWHRKLLEGKAGLFAVATTVAISIGGLVELVPMFTTVDPAAADIEPYTPLEVAGRDIYVREGCYVCHSQMVRPMRAETLRYGDWSRSAEYTYDRPFQLGSRRIGPDLHRVGGKYPDAWHYEHMNDPRATTPGSVMPPYSWLLENSYDPADVQASVSALQTLGTPYTDEEVAAVPASLKAQADAIVARLADQGIQATPDKEIIAMIAYLQKLGTQHDAAVASLEGK
jgi:cytochrome c oxidase cbb3-type subunit I/II